MSAVKRLFRFDYTAAAGHMKMPSAYSERYEKRYGFWRPVIGDVVRKFLRCGDLHFGFARLRCSGSECAHEMFVPFSCRQRCLCPSCHQKRALLLADRIAHQICLPVPHRQYVWTVRAKPLDKASGSAAAKPGLSAQVPRETREFTLHRPSDRLRASTVRDLLRSVLHADAQTAKQTGRWTKKPPAEGDQKCAKGHEIFDSAPAGELFSERGGH